MKQELIAVSSYEGEGYVPMIDFESWRVAILNYCEELEIQNLKTMQKHDESDEVFVLLSGNCTLFTGGNGEEVGEIDRVAMVPKKLYNVKKGVYHTHTLDKEGSVLIVENQNTCDENSPTKDLTEEQIVALRRHK
jgi:hypothetical protein